jgi:hypothetical protein
MKKLLVIIVLGLLLCGNAYAYLGCNLKSSKIIENYTKGRLEISIYNPNKTRIHITHIIYYNGNTVVPFNNGKHKRTDVGQFVGPQSTINFHHSSSESFLKSINNIKFQCNIIDSTNRSGQRYKEYIRRW